MTLDTLLIQLKGKTIDHVDMHSQSDCGLEIYFTDGTTLSFGYSSMEGSTWFNGEIIKELL